MILELLGCKLTLTNHIYWIVDWGSQSIAQSKFQRAPSFTEGKVHQELLFSLRQSLFSRFSKFFQTVFKELTASRLALPRCLLKGGLIKTTFVFFVNLFFRDFLFFLKRLSKFLRNVSFRKSLCQRLLSKGGSAKTFVFVSSTLFRKFFRFFRKTFGSETQDLQRTSFVRRLAWGDPSWREGGQCRSALSAQDLFRLFLIRFQKLLIMRY